MPLRSIGVQTRIELPGSAPIGRAVEFELLAILASRRTSAWIVCAVDQPGTIIQFSHMARYTGAMASGFLGIQYSQLLPWFRTVLTVIKMHGKYAGVHVTQ